MVGLPLYIYCILLAVVCIREACKSILKLRIGSSVIRICTSSVFVVEAGVAIESLVSNHPKSRARSIYESPISPKAKSSPGDSTEVCLVCPKASPIFGINPGRAITYWLRYTTLAERAIIKIRDKLWAVLYHDFLSNGSLGETVNFNRTILSTLLIILIRFSPSFLYFKLKSFPSSVLATTMRRLDFLLWVILRVVSGRKTISCSKLFLFLGKERRCSWALFSLTVISFPSGVVGGVLRAASVFFL